MTNEYVMDTSAWIEYLRGTDKGMKVKELVEQGKTATPIIVLFELADKCVREGWDFKKAVQFVLRYSPILDLSKESAYEVATFKQEQRKKKVQFGLIDAIIFTIAQHHRAHLITGDHHFQDIPNVLFLD